MRRLLSLVVVRQAVMGSLLPPEAGGSTVGGAYFPMTTTRAYDNPICHSKTNFDSIFLVLQEKKKKTNWLVLANLRLNRPTSLKDVSLCTTFTYSELGVQLMSAIISESCIQEVKMSVFGCVVCICSTFLYLVILSLLHVLLCFICVVTVQCAFRATILYRM